MLQLRGAQGTELRTEHQDVAKLLPGLRLSQAYGADIRVREDRCRDKGVIHLPRGFSGTRAEQVVHQLHGLTQSYWRQLHAGRDIS